MVELVQHKLHVCGSGRSPPRSLRPGGVVVKHRLPRTHSGQSGCGNGDRSTYTTQTASDWEAGACHCRTGENSRGPSSRSQTANRIASPLVTFQPGPGGSGVGKLPVKWCPCTPLQSNAPSPTADRRNEGPAVLWPTIPPGVGSKRRYVARWHHQAIDRQCLIVCLCSFNFILSQPSSPIKWRVPDRRIRLCL